jgi:fructokinase
VTQLGREDRHATRLYGGIEAGGTQFVCAVGTETGTLRALTRIKTTTPASTIGQALEFFRRQAEPVAAVGIGSFGPLDSDRKSPTFGHITTTPKAGWQNVDIAGEFRAGLGVVVGFDTDVNAAALGEHSWGAARDADTLLYVTVGTGIGGGGIVSGILLHGLVHPEMGHVRVPHDLNRDPFEGVCPYHGDCLEGLASGPAIEARWGRPGELLPIDHAAWGLEAHYLALGLVNYICVLSPRRIILGGGVMGQAHLYPKVREEVQAMLNRYVQAPAILEHIETYIVPPELGERAGVLGAIALAQRAYQAGQGI